MRILILAFILVLGFSAKLIAKQVYVDGEPFVSLAESVSAITDGARIYLKKGVYTQGAYITESNISILGEAGVIFDGAVADHKAALVLTGNNVTVESIECVNISVRDGNGACIRFEGENLIVRDLYAHDSESGIMTSHTGGRVLIEFSKFERLGNRNGYSHAMYINVDDLVVRYSQIISTKKQGSGIKSRSKKVLVENSLLASLNGQDSRLIDMANYGELIVKNSILQQGPNSSNSQLIAYGLEKDVKKRFPTNRIELKNNLIFFDRDINVLISKRLDDEFVSSGNIIIGDLNHPRQMVPGNDWYFQRADAGLKAFPYLPTIDERTTLMTKIRAFGTKKN